MVKELVGNVKVSVHGVMFTTCRISVQGGAIKFLCKKNTCLRIIQYDSEESNTGHVKDIKI